MIGLRVFKKLFENEQFQIIISAQKARALIQLKQEKNIIIMQLLLSFECLFSSITSAVKNRPASVHTTASVAPKIINKVFIAFCFNLFLYFMSI